MSTGIWDQLNDPTIRLEFKSEKENKIMIQTGRRGLWNQLKESGENVSHLSMKDFDWDEFRKGWEDFLKLQQEKNGAKTAGR